MSDPTPSRPFMPGYGISPAEEGEGLLAWTWAAERFAQAHNYWIATTRPNGAAHLTAVWGVWLDDVFVFSCATNSRKALNLAANPACSVSTEQANEAVIVEGVARELKDQSLLERFKAAYDPKYDWKIDIDRGGIYQVQPRVAFAFIEHSDQFQTTATRWTFD